MHYRTSHYIIEQRFGYIKSQKKKNKNKLVPKEIMILSNLQGNSL